MTHLIAPLLAEGLTLSQWYPSQMAAGEDARAFCLATIKQTYGYNYRPDWHADLDSLTQGEDGWYAARKGGAFLIVRNAGGDVIATGGIYPISRKPGLRAELGEGRYADWNKVAGLARTYIHPSYRGKGLSRSLVALLEQAAQNMGYTHLNLHCEASALRLRNHWESFGFTNILNDANTSHYDKIVHTYSEKTESRHAA